MRICARVLALLVVAASAIGAPSNGAQTPPIPVFVEPGPESGLTGVTVAAEIPWIFVTDNVGTGVALLDYDLDGDLDIFQVQASRLGGFPGPDPPTHHLYRNEGGGRFTDVTRQAGVADHAWGQGAIAGDYDNDGDPDLFVATQNADLLYRNEGDGTFREIALQAGVADAGWGTAAAFFDYDEDGLLDLYVSKYLEFDEKTTPPRGDPDHPCTFRGVPVVCGPMSLPKAVGVLYHNNGDGTFSHANQTAGLPPDALSYGLGVVTGDVDADGDVDLFVANDSEPNYLYVNDGKGRFSEEGLLRGVAYAGDGRAQASMGTTFGDPDGDGDLDLFLTHFSHDYCTYYENDGTGFFEDQSLRAGLVEPTIRSLSWGALFIDLDNDGDEDLLITNSHVYPEADDAQIGSRFLQRCQLFLNDGKAKFTEVLPPAAGPALAHEAAHRGSAYGDIDEDGDIDMVVTRMFERLGYYRNDLPPGNNWIAFRLRGTRSNRDAIGARLRIRSGERQWLKELHGGGSFESSNDPRIHLGLGPLTRVDEVEIAWPSGLVEKRGPFDARRTVVLVEPPAPSQGIRIP